MNRMRVLAHPVYCGLRHFRPQLLECLPQLVVEFQCQAHHQNLFRIRVGILQKPACGESDAFDGEECQMD